MGDRDVVGAEPKPNRRRPASNACRASEHSPPNSYHQWLANRGYAVLSVNFRGSSGFGKNFINAGDGEWAAKMHDDLLDAVDWAVKHGVAPAYPLPENTLPDPSLLPGGAQ